MRIDGFTPKEFAVSLLSNVIEAIHSGKSDDLDTLTASQRKAVQAQLSSIRTNLLDGAKLDALPLKEEAK